MGKYTQSERDQDSQSQGTVHNSVAPEDLLQNLLADAVTELVQSPAAAAVPAQNAAAAAVPELLQAAIPLQSQATASINTTPYSCDANNHKDETGTPVPAPVHVQSLAAVSTPVLVPNLAPVQTHGQTQSLEPVSEHSLGAGTSEGLKRKMPLSDETTAEEATEKIEKQKRFRRTKLEMEEDKRLNPPRPKRPYIWRLSLEENKLIPKPDNIKQSLKQSKELHKIRKRLAPSQLVEEPEMTADKREEFALQIQAYNYVLKSYKSSVANQPEQQNGPVTQRWQIIRHNREELRLQDQQRQQPPQMPQQQPPLMPQQQTPQMLPSPMPQLQQHPPMPQQQTQPMLPSPMPRQHSPPIPRQKIQPILPPPMPWQLPPSMPRQQHPPMPQQPSTSIPRQPLMPQLQQPPPMPRQHSPPMPRQQTPRMLPSPMPQQQPSPIPRQQHLLIPQQQPQMPQQQSKQLPPMPQQQPMQQQPMQQPPMPQLWTMQHQQQLQQFTTQLQQNIPISLQQDNTVSGQTGPVHMPTGHFAAQQQLPKPNESKISAEKVAELFKANKELFSRVLDLQNEAK